MHYLLTYEYTADYLERRGTYRNAHIAKAWQAQERGELLLAGAAGEARCLSSTATVRPPSRPLCKAIPTT